LRERYLDQTPCSGSHGKRGDYRERLLMRQGTCFVSVLKLSARPPPRREPEWGPVFCHENKDSDAGYGKTQGK